MLNQLRVGRGLKQKYAEAIERYLEHCLGNGLVVGFASARSFVSDGLRRGLTRDGVTWKEALNWFSREGRKCSAPRPGAVAGDGAGGQK